MSCGARHGLSLFHVLLGGPSGLAHAEGAPRCPCFATEASRIWVRRGRRARGGGLAPARGRPLFAGAVRTRAAHPRPRSKEGRGVTPRSAEEGRGGSPSGAPAPREAGGGREGAVHHAGAGGVEGGWVRALLLRCQRPLFLAASLPAPAPRQGSKRGAPAPPRGSPVPLSRGSRRLGAEDGAARPALRCQPRLGGPFGALLPPAAGRRLRPQGSGRGGGDGARPSPSSAPARTARPHGLGASRTGSSRVSPKLSNSRGEGRGWRKAQREESPPPGGGRQEPSRRVTERAADRGAGEP